jgi:hypothetical protein
MAVELDVVDGVAARERVAVLGQRIGLQHLVCGGRLVAVL